MAGCRFPKPVPPAVLRFGKAVFFLDLARLILAERLALIACGHTACLSYLSVRDLRGNGNGEVCRGVPGNQDPPGAVPGRNAHRYVDCGVEPQVCFGAGLGETWMTCCMGLSFYGLRLRGWRGRAY